MTYHYPPYPPYPQPPPPIRRGPNYAKVFALVAIGVLAFVLILVLAVFAYHHNNAASTAGDSHTSTVRSSNSEQWFAAVYKTQMFFSEGGGNGKWLTHSVRRGSCPSSLDPGIWIFIGECTSEYLARDDAALMRLNGCASAMMRDTEGYMLFASLSDSSGASLQPLAQFGFTITPAR